jgi:hypothetical protein
VHAADSALRVRVLDNGAAVITERSVGGPEGAENGG